MGIYLNPGNEGFQISLSSDIYVDKTELISFTNARLGKENRFICVSRPRRFGKSMTANMLAAYYGKECDSRNLFQNLLLAQKKNFDKHLNQYHVIFFEMQRFLARSGDAMKLVPYLEACILRELRQQFPGSMDCKETHLAAALEQIYLADKTGFILIFDEWDCVFREEKENKEAQKLYLDFLRDLLKGQVYVKLAYMTGILPIKKYGTQSALNMFDEYSMMNAGELASYMGFTAQEVSALCGQYGMDFEAIQNWYDGYHFPQAPHVYSPKSVVDAVQRKRLDSYWTGTETYEALKAYIEMNFDGLKDAILLMLSGGNYRINPRTFQNDMSSFQGRDDVLALLVHLGYLSYEQENQSVSIPNREVAEEFKSAIECSSHWGALANALRHSDELLNATLRLDEEAVARGIDQTHSDQTALLSYNDENSLSCVISLAYFSARKYYTLIRELPSGKGFADIVFLPYKNSDKPAIIVELKWNKSASGAIAQIKQRQYQMALNEYQGNLLLVGINYDKKTKRHQCKIEVAKKSDANCNL